MWIAQNSTMGKKARLVATIISSVGPSIFMWQFFNKDANKKNENGILKYILLGCYSLGNAWIVHKHDSDDQQDLATKNLFLGFLGYALALSADHYYSYRQAAKEAEAKIKAELKARQISALEAEKQKQAEAEALKRIAKEAARLNAEPPNEEEAAEQKRRKEEEAKAELIQLIPWLKEWPKWPPEDWKG